MKKSIFITLVLINSINISQAQSSFQVHLGLTFPSGDFANYDEVNDFYSGALGHTRSGNASTGLDLGVKYQTPAKVDGLFLVLNINLLYNLLNKDYREDIEDDIIDDTDFANISFPKFINIPILAGLKYEIPVKEKLAFYGEGGLGFNMLKITKFKYKTEYYDYSEKYSPSLKLGFTIGGGVLIQDKFSIGLNYYGLGSHKVKFEQKWANSTNTNTDNGRFDRALDIRAFTLTFGIKL